jgi:hypothetical protein
MTGPIVLNERQAAAAVQGVEHYNDARADNGVRLSPLAVDTNGYINAVMAVAKLLASICARDCTTSRSASSTCLGRSRFPKASSASPQLRSPRQRSSAAGTNCCDWWLRFAAAASAKDALDKLGSAAAGNPMHRALTSSASCCARSFSGDYYTNEEFRREIHTLLNRGESVHQRAIYYGLISPERGGAAKR